MQGNPLFLAHRPTETKQESGGAVLVLSVAKRHSVNMRVAAYMLAIERVAAVHRLRGMYA